MGEHQQLSLCSAAANTILVVSTQQLLLSGPAAPVRVVAGCGFVDGCAPAWRSMFLCPLLLAEELHDVWSCLGSIEAWFWALEPGVGSAGTVLQVLACS